MHRHLVNDASSIPSPSLLFFEDILHENLQKTIALSGGTEHLRPHVKTHKTKELCAMQRAQGITKFKCATIAEAEMLGQVGAPEVLLAYPLVGPNVERFLKLSELCPQTNFQAVFDDLGTLKVLAAAAHAQGKTVEAMIDIDCGMHRTGVSFAEAPALYEAASRLHGIAVAGIHCYDGHFHQSDLRERTAAATACHAQTLALRDDLVSCGLPVPHVVMGGTPTFAIYAALGDVEVSPGTCFLNDWGYHDRFADLQFAPAALLLSRVVSVNKAESTFTLDTGHKALSADPKGVRGVVFGREPGFGEPLFQSEEHWVLRCNQTLPAIGTVLYVLPTHICPTVALHANARVISKGEQTATWDIISRNRKLSV